MKKFLLILISLISLSSSKITAQEVNFNVPIKITADSEKGFFWSYYLFIPDSSILQNKSVKLFIIPNNTGRISDSIEVHNAGALVTLTRGKMIADQLKTIVLVPVFPRSKKDGKIYTHALDRDVMITENDSLKRLDLQLISMIKDAKEKLLQKNIIINDKILMLGFSASGMFVNRFTLLHPEKVLAAAIGSPGGWPIVPVKNYNGVNLNYPVGIYDLKEISGIDFNKNEFNNVKIYFFLGEEDDNDSVVFDDSYDEPERKVILENFGETLQERWRICQDFYKDFNNCNFVLYPDIGHTINGQIISDLLNFYKVVLELE